MKPPDDLTKEQLIRDLTRLRARISVLEQSEDDKKKYKEELVQTKAMFEGLFEFAPDAIVVVNRKGNIVRANKQTERLFGYSANELADSHHEILLPERFKKRHIKHRRTYMADPHIRPMGTGLELYGRKKDGSEFSVDIALGPLKAEKETLVIAVIRDVSEHRKSEAALRTALDEMELKVTERTSALLIANEELLTEIEERKQTEAQLEEYRRDLEEQVTERTAELMDVNKELEAFSYSVSHDLRAPLRQMAGFITLLQKQIADYPNIKVRQYIASILAASRKMDVLINDLLAFSQIGRTEIQKKKVSLDELVRGVMREIRDEFKERNIIWEVDELPAIIGDRGLLRQVIVNLISNAVKFTSTRSQAEIKIGCKDEDDKYTFFISDNGVGFDMKYADRLFGVFQRLHTQDDFEGTGIGLANVQRIIARHGGRVWAEGAVGQGATFYFTLPKIKEK